MAPALMGDGKDCPLCNIADSEVLVEFPGWKLARTKTMKGHRERLMLYHENHEKTLDEQSVGEAFLLLMMTGQKFFSNARKWAIFEPVYATVPDHWHRVASDLDPNCDDHEQILKTPRLVIDMQEMTVNKVNPESESQQPGTPSRAMRTYGSNLNTSKKKRSHLSRSEAVFDSRVGS